MPVNYDSGFYNYEQATVTYDGTDTSPPNTRFILDASTLNDFSVGLDGASPAFTLDTSTLDGLGKLDGYTFLTVATAASTLGGLASTATATVVKVAVASAPLDALTASATASVVLVATASASLGGMTATVDSTPTILPIFEANLGALSSTATATVITPTPAEPAPTGGRMVYSRQPRKKLEPVVQVIEIPVIQPKQRYGVASTSLSAMQAQAESTITFSILEDDAELLLML